MTGEKLKSFMKRLPPLSSMDFGQGKVPSAQQLESVSSWSQSSKGVLLNSPNDTGVIYLIYLIYSSQHIRLQVCFLRLWEGTCAVSQLQGTRLPKDPKPSLEHFLSSLIQDTLLI